MEPGYVAPVILVAMASPCALGQVVADFDWSIDALLVTLADPTPPPINITQGSFFVSENLVSNSSPDPSNPTMGRGDLTLADGGSGMIDYSAASDPMWFSHFVDLFHNPDSPSNPQIFINDTTFDPDLGEYTVNDLIASPGAPYLHSRLTPGEIAALMTADIQFFRLNVADLSIVNGYQGDETKARVTAHGTFEVWIPTPGATALLGVAGFPLIARRRR